MLMQLPPSDTKFWRFYRGIVLVYRVRVNTVTADSAGLVHHARKVIHRGPPSHCQTREFVRKNAANFLSMANLLMGLSSILCNLNGYRQWACWLLLIGFMLDLADGAVARQLNTCSALGAKLDDFADFTSFGLATALLLHRNGPMDALLVMVYDLAVFTRLCFYSSGIPFMYRGLPCPYASAILSCASLLTSGHPLVLRAIAIIMILFMIDQGIYPHDKILESQAWKKMVFAGAAIISDVYIQTGGRGVCREHSNGVWDVPLQVC
ncbi:transmembrane protein 269 isoform X5 [Rana temporaria]|uniref:transmembrane protein 269 isoform X5 n=1 Tax=Rana temporaria TaxID=8407 RepID=UPI001AAD8E84|nr:transmembrane protein 269 isoform X5 [Rana temporaria]